MIPFPHRGERLPSLELHAITQRQVDAYLLASGDDNQIHRDADLARRLGLPGIPVPGMMVMAQLANCLQRWPVCGSIARFTARFFAPVLVDGELRIEASVVAADEDARRAVVRLTATQSGRPAVMAEAEVLIAECSVDGDQSPDKRT